MNFAALAQYLGGFGMGSTGKSDLEKNKMPHASMRSCFRNMSQDSSVYLFKFWFVSFDMCLAGGACCFVIICLF